MARNKRQARLAFNPLPTSSPTTKKAVEEHGQRNYASVGYEGAERRIKRRKIADEVAIGATVNDALPTPEKSSQFPIPSKHATIVRTEDGNVDDSFDSSLPVPPSTRKLQKRAKQARLDFANHIGARLEESEKETGDDSDSSSGPAVVSSTRKKRTTKNSGIFGTQRPASPGPDSESEDDIAPPRSTRKKSRRSALSPQPAIEDEYGIEDQPRSTRRTSRRHLKSPESDQESDRVQLRSAKKKEKKSHRSKVTRVDLTLGESESSGDDAPALYTSPLTNRKRSAVKSKKETDFVVPSDDDQQEAESEQESEEQPVRNRKLRRGPREVTEQEKEDLDEDLQWLNSSPPGAKFTSGPRKVNKRAELLAQLKQQRAGGPQSSPASRPARAVVLDSSDEEEEEAEEEDSIDRDFSRGANARRRAIYDKQDDDDDFVVDDEDDQLGAPTQDLEMPLWATGFTRMKPKELFRFVVEWMVQKKLNPAFNQEPEKYGVAFQKLNDEVQGLAGSKFTSAAWTRDFTVSLQARPSIEIKAIGGMAGELDFNKCQACNRSGHPATYNIKFIGKPYHPSTLEPLEQDGDDDDDAGSEVEQFDHKERAVPAESHTYDVGRFCKDKAEIAHGLNHWKYNLKEWVVDYLRDEGHLTDRKIVKRDSWDEPKRRKYARKVMENMEDNGKVKELYKTFRQEIDTARNSTTEWRGRDSGY